MEKENKCIFEKIQQKDWNEFLINLKDKKIEVDLIDLKSLSPTDTTIEILENFIRDEYGLVLGESFKELKANQEKYDYLIHQELKKEEERTELEFKKGIKEIIKNKNLNLDKYFEIPKALLRAVIKDKEGSLHSFFWQSPAGLGKTTVTLITLTELNAEYAYINNYSTPLELVNLIYLNKNKILVFDDTENIFNEKIINILKGALGGIGKKNKRLVSYHTTDKRLTSPSQFEFNGKMIFLLNIMPNKENELVKALLSRSLVYESRLTYHEILGMLAEFVKIDYKDLNIWQREEIFNYLKENSDETTENLNFRTLIKLYDLFRSGEDWKVLGKTILNKDERKALIKKLIKESNTIKEAEQKFCGEIGCCRKTFYNLRKQMECKV